MDEGLAGLHIAFGVDVAHPRRGHLHLGLAEGGAQREELAVEVAGAHDIVIHQSQVAYARAGQGLHGKGTHAAQAEHRHARGTQPLQRRLAEQQLAAGKPSHAWGLTLRWRRAATGPAA